MAPELNIRCVVADDHPALLHAVSEFLVEAGVEVVATRYAGQVHGFWRHGDAFDAAEPLMWQVAGWMRMLLERG